MMRSGIAWPGGTALVHLLVALNLYRMLMPEVYHRVSDKIGYPVLLVVAWLIFALLGGTAARHIGPRWRSRFGRMLVLALLLLLSHGIVGGAYPDEGTASAGSGLGLGGLAAAVLVLVLVAALLRDERWRQLSRLIWIAAPLFVLSEPLMAKLLAPDLSWPPPSQQAAPVDPGGKAGITLVLILDELDASAAQPLIKVLADEGLKVQTKALVPVGDATMKVIPELFLRKSFEQARACGPSVICSGSSVLDFSGIQASRPDIDVVGFFHPYCRIKGLRSCHRAVVPFSFYQADRLRCASWRRLGWPRNTTLDECERVAYRPWHEMVNDSLAAVAKAPVWQLGGLLFAHVPLPHPPGQAVGGSLARHYQDNVARAADMLSGLVRQARDGGRSIQVVISSDHPLRPARWCQTWAYAMRGCHETAHFSDSHVPLIVAGAHPVDLSAVTQNDQLFSVLAQLGN